MGRQWSKGWKRADQPVQALGCSPVSPVSPVSPEPHSGVLITLPVSQPEARLLVVCPKDTVQQAATWAASERIRGWQWAPSLSSSLCGREEAATGHSVSDLHSYCVWWIVQDLKKAAGDKIQSLFGVPRVPHVLIQPTGIFTILSSFER